MKPITTALVVSPLVTCANVTVTPVITATCATVTPIAIGSSLRNDCSRSSIPRMNSSISTPRSARVSMAVEFSISPKPVGPSTTPTRMNPATAGRRSRFITSPAITAAASTRASAVRSCVCIARESHLPCPDDRLAK